MPRHEQISPEEDLAAFPVPAGPGGTDDRRAPPSLAKGPPPVPAGVVSAPAEPSTGEGPVIPEPTRTNNGGLAPVRRPMPSFKDPPASPAVAPVSSVLAALISLILPGAGQIYAGQTMKGVVLLVVAFFTCFGGGVFNVLAAIDAYLIAERRARGEAVGEWQIF